MPPARRWKSTSLAPAPSPATRSWKNPRHVKSPKTRLPTPLAAIKHTVHWHPLEWTAHLQPLRRIQVLVPKGPTTPLWNWEAALKFQTTRVRLLSLNDGASSYMHGWFISCDGTDQQMKLLCIMYVYVLLSMRRLVSRCSVGWANIVCQLSCRCCQLPYSLQRPRPSCQCASQLQHVCPRVRAIQQLRSSHLQGWPRCWPPRYFGVLINILWCMVPTYQYSVLMCVIFAMYGVIIIMESS